MRLEIVLVALAILASNVQVNCGHVQGRKENNICGFCNKTSYAFLKVVKRNVNLLTITTRFLGAFTRAESRTLSCLPIATS